MTQLNHVSCHHRFNRVAPSAHLSSCEDVPRELDLGEVPLADGLEEPVVADVGVLLSGGQGVSASWQAVAAG